MSADSLVAMLEDEHQQIDAAIDGFLADRSPDGRETGPLLAAVSALRRHIYLEEEFLFPSLPDPALAAPVFVMLREHAQIWRLLDSLEREIRADDGEAATQLCRQLGVLLLHHNQKEERIIYPAAAETIPDPTLEQIAELSETTPGAPTNWICVKARD